MEYRSTIVKEYKNSKNKHNNSNKNIDKNNDNSRSNNNKNKSNNNDSNNMNGKNNRNNRQYGKCMSAARVNIRVPKTPLRVDPGVKGLVVSFAPSKFPKINPCPFITGEFLTVAHVGFCPAGW